MQLLAEALPSGEPLQAQLQVSEAVFVTFVPSPAGTVAVTITGPEVAPLHVAVPKVLPCTLLMLTLMLSETDQVPFVRLL